MYAVISLPSQFCTYATRQQLLSNHAAHPRSDFKISTSVPWVQGLKSRIAELEINRTQIKRAPPLTVAMIIALEVSVVSIQLQEYYRAMCWVILLCTWGCLRLSDLEGLDPSRLFLGSRGLRGTLGPNEDDWPGETSSGDSHFRVQTHLPQRTRLASLWV